ncbi:aminopeptidase P family protein [Streptomyces lunaelactis]|uniref:aminopeptidase P family protein n=1 Tax=Streptomyces lunaelactis TaxID=1535768 RepID=UPI001585D12C|nr:aminopeptidase P family protein [Streptomyces lunaelactis]NUK07400.1 aminopeptidase P family protein [Streptomyces lunaelactis]NUK14774.1 aminopeptidase P family protein [Streptomyces lunaelactis]NUK22156.1 aminopeptidase P family protein [Streptomyces lunaelactis]NUL09425.1 aminopeptidase P family protein [Streptomyces lunaelactis]NUL22231.1 aminopeptidase P family protein [Streptomyces lunaelactis]
MTQPALRTGSHDLTPSAELQAFMARDWAAGPLPGELLLPAARFTPSRRARLSGRFPGERLLIPAGGLTVRSNDCDYRFRPHSAYAWLTGLTGEDQAGHVLVLEPSGPSGHEAVLHVRPRSPRDGGEEFYRDRRYGEFWVGRRPDLAEAERMTGVRCEHLDAYGKLPPGRDATHDAELASVLSELRLIKDAWEVDQLQLAVDHTASGFEDVVRALPRALSHPRGERWIEGVFGLRARAEGNGTGYDTIAASGAHACVLHWIRNDGALDPQKLLLLDAGVETDSLYTADITRTLPLSGRFSFLQLQVYELVLAAQEAGMAALRPGASFRDFHRAGMRVIAEGLAEWGILKSPEGDLHRRYTLCSSGHMLGVDVHDCAQARSETYLDGVLSEGNVLTVEPGLYFQPDDETLPAELRGIGVRIEDDLVITEDGARLMSGALPRTPDGIESWMGELLDG